MKKFAYFFLFVFLVSFTLLGASFFIPENANAAVPGYDYQVVEKSPDATLNAGGESVVLWTKIRNSGSISWVGSGDHAIHLGTADNLDRHSSFYSVDNWVSPNRVHQTLYGPYYNGDVADFGFIAKTNTSMAPGTYTECFYPVVENVTWMKNEKICWNINVENSNPDVYYDAETVSDFRYYDLNMQPGETRDIVFKAKNTGNKDWTRHSNIPLHLATIHPADRSSDMYDSSWISQNRPTVVEENVVRPGEIGTFNFTIQAPVTGNGEELFVEHFWLVAEHDAWVPDPSLKPNGPIFSVVAHVDYGGIEYSEKNSTMLISSDSIEANGEDSATVTIRLRDDQNKPIKYDKVNLNVAQFNRDTNEYNATTYSLETDFRGEAFKEFQATTSNVDYAFTFKYKLYDEYPDWVFLTTRRNDSKISVFDPQNSKLYVSKNQAKASGYDTVNVTAEIRDQFNELIPYQTIDLNINNCLLTDGDWHDCWQEDVEYGDTDGDGKIVVDRKSYSETVQIYSASIDNKFFLQTPIVEFVDEYEDNIEYSVDVTVKENDKKKQYSDSNSDVQLIVDQLLDDMYNNLDTNGNRWGTYSMTKELEEEHDTVEIVFDPHTSIVHDKPYGRDMDTEIRKDKTEVVRLIVLFNDDDTASVYFDRYSTGDDRNFDSQSDVDRQYSYLYAGFIPSQRILNLVDKL